MKKLINTTLLLACLAGTGFISSCSKSDSGSSCPAWYEGVNCQTEMRAKFYGVFKGTAHEPDGGELPIQWTITAGTAGTNSIYINAGMGTDGKPVAWNAVLTGSNTFGIPLQDMGNNNPLAPGVSYADQGSGTLNGNQLTVNWTSKGSSWNLNWTITAIRQ